MTNTDQVSGLHVSIATQKDDQKRGMASVSVGYIHAFFFSCHVETELITVVLYALLWTLSCRPTTRHRAAVAPNGERQDLNGKGLHSPVPAAGQLHLRSAT
ncbi:hypothetical protein GQ55_2G236800 [Panicum hallii var. hallii]|uniref:Uncharacterized protein n=1 Tax=Panicum hallii var. hallii TaxID=1504633 RepID=A0A2T7ERP2_9POAL|nr:hypothetical protein GQ55_2G236800 [Panicum hallii var. hallii]